MKVLSGSSTRKMVPKTTAAVARSSPTASTLGSAADAARIAVRARRCRPALGCDRSGRAGTDVAANGGAVAAAPSLSHCVRSPPRRGAAARDPPRGSSALLVAGVVVLLRRSADLRRRVTALEQHRPAGDADLAALRADLGQALRHVAVVRYDAFGDMGGRLSFSAAVIDDHGDGLVVQLDPRARRVAHLRQGRRRRHLRRHPHPRGAAGPRRCPHRQGDPVTRYGYLGPEGTFTSMALDAWEPAGERRAHGLRLGRRGARPRCGPATSTARWCRSRTPSRAGSRPPSTPSPAVTRSSSPARCSCRSPSCSRRGPARPSPTCARSAPTRTRGRRCAAGWASTCRMPCTCRPCRPPRPPRASSRARRPTRRRCAPRPPPGCTGSRCSPTASATCRRR